MPKLVIENFDVGLDRNFVLLGSETANRKRGDGKHLVLGSLGGVSPFQNPGYLVPGFSATDIDASEVAIVTTKITSWAVKSTFATNQTSELAAYGIGDNLLYKIEGTGYATIVNNTPSTPLWPHTIASVVLVSGDNGDVAVEIQNIGGVQKECLFYSYNIASGAGKLGRFDITTDSNWTTGNSSDTAYTLTTNDVSAPDVTSILSVPRPMVTGTNKILYIANGYKIDSLDLTVSSAAISLNALDIDQNYEIQSMAFFQGELVIAAQLKQSNAGIQKGRVAVFFWNTFAATFSDPVFIDEDSCGALYSDDRNLYLFTSNSVYGNLRLWDGRGFSIIQQTSKAIPLHGGVDSIRNGLVWGDSDAKAWWFGEATEGRGKWLWNFTKIGTSLSCVRKLSPTGDILHFTGQTTGSVEFIKSTNTNFLTSEASMTIADLPHRSTIRRVEAQFIPLESGASMTLSFANNLTASGATLYGSISFASDGAVSRKVFSSRITNISQLGLNFAWASGTKTVKLERLIIDYFVPNTKQHS